MKARVALFWLLCSTVILSACALAAPPPSFSADIQPIFTERCIKCHSGENPPRGLRLDSYERVIAGGTYRSVVEPGNSEGSVLIKRIRGISTPRMPFDGPPYLSDEQMIKIESWIAAGALDD